MKREEKKLHKIFLDSQPEVSLERKKRAIEAAVLSRNSSIKCRNISFYEKFKISLSYSSKTIWALQIVVLFIAAWIIKDSSYAISLTALLMPVLSLLIILDVAKSFQNNMWEMEQSCRFSLQQIVGAKFLLWGIFDLLLLSLMVVLGSYGNIQIMYLIWYLLIPFCFSNCIYLFLLKKLRAIKNIWGIGTVMVIIIGTFNFLVKAINSNIKLLIFLTKPFCTIFILGLLVVIMIIQVLQFKKICKESGQEWSCV